MSHCHPRRIALCTSPHHTHTPLPPPHREDSPLVLAGTIQFSTAIQLAKQRLGARFPSLAVPKCRPLSPGEVLGCTAPVIDKGTGAEAIVFVADGRCAQLPERGGAEGVSCWVVLRPTSRGGRRDGGGTRFSLLVSSTVLFTHPSSSPSLLFTSSSPRLQLHFHHGSVPLAFSYPPSLRAPSPTD